MSMPRFAVCNEVFERWSLKQVFEYVSRVGYDGVEIAPYTIAEKVTDIDRRVRRSIREDAESFGLDIAGIHWVLRGVSGVHLTSPDPTVRGRTESYLKALIDFCSDIGGRVIVFGSPAQRSIPRGVDSMDAWMWAVDIFRRCSQYAEQRGVYICIEPLRRDMTNFINTVGEAIRFIEDVGHPNFRLILDVYAMTGVDEPIDRQIERGGAYLMHFHANDDNMGGPGFGSADYRAVVRGLRGIGFKGYVSVEILRKEEDPAEAVRVSIENLKRFFREY
ncbi:MAG: sugar phosphate isomerase/epimerase family protein [Candidatus Bathyarchaeia archaeon]